MIRWWFIQFIDSYIDYIVLSDSQEAWQVRLKNVDIKVYKGQSITFQGLKFTLEHYIFFSPSQELLNSIMLNLINFTYFDTSNRNWTL